MNNSFDIMKSHHQGLEQTSKRQFGLTFPVQIEMRDVGGKRRLNILYLKQNVLLTLVRLPLLCSALQCVSLACRGAGPWECKNAPFLRD